MWRVRPWMINTCVVLCFQPLLTPHHSSHSTLLFIHARARNPPARSRCVSLRERRVRVRVRRSLLALVLARVHCHEVCGRHRRLVATRMRYRNYFAGFVVHCVGRTGCR